MLKNEEELKRSFEELYARVKAGLGPESVKTELKREWYNLNKSIGPEKYKVNVSKFIKEIGAIANSYGPGNGHIIIGLGEDATITHSPLSVSGLNDESELYGLVVKCIDKPVRFEFYEIVVNLDGSDKTISIIVVPISIDKPHVMYEYVTENSRYENFTPVKKGTVVRSASRTDLDLMYYDNQNIVPEYAVNIRTFIGSRLDIKPAGASVSLDFPLVFENYGRKPMVLVKCDLVITECDGSALDKEIILTLGSYSIANVSNTRKEVIQQPIIIGSNETLAYTCHFYSWQAIIYDTIKSGKYLGYFSARDIYGNPYDSSIFRTGV